MNDTQREQIKEFRGKGYGYGRIAQILSLSENTIRHIVEGTDSEEWWQTLHPLTEKCIIAFGVAKRWCSREDGKRRSSARINAEISGGIAILIR